MRTQERQTPRTRALAVHAQVPTPILSGWSVAPPVTWCGREIVTLVGIRLAPRHVGSYKRATCRACLRAMLRAAIRENLAIVGEGRHGGR